MLMISTVLQSQQLLNIGTDVQVSVIHCQLYNYGVNFMHRMGTQHP